MACIWYQKESGEWAPWVLDGAAVPLGPRLLPLLAGDGAQASALLLSSRSAGPVQWLAMRIAARPFYLNGASLLTGIRVISHRDEMRLAGGARIFFSTERLPRVEPFPGADREVRCPRCRRAISAGAPIVRCQCNAAFHQDTDPSFQCYTYAASCPLCAGPTELSDTYRWQPEGGQ